MKVRRGVLGDAHVDRAEAAKTAFDAAFQTFITEGAWGSVWSRPDAITPRERSMITIALLAGLGQLRGAGDAHPRHRATPARRRRTCSEAMLHVAIYAGVPRANHAIKIAKETYAEMEQD